MVTLGSGSLNGLRPGCPRLGIAFDSSMKSENRVCRRSLRRERRGQGVCAF
jgi:hypothetical protein